MSWVDRSSLWSHSVPLVPPPPCRLPHMFPPGYHSIWCQWLRYRCSWLLSRTDPLCGSEGPKSASAPSGCCWPYDRAWGLLDNRDLQEWVFDNVDLTSTHRFSCTFFGWYIVVKYEWFAAMSYFKFTEHFFTSTIQPYHSPLTSHSQIGMHIFFACVLCMLSSSLDENPWYLHSDLCPVLLMASRLTL